MKHQLDEGINSHSTVPHATDYSPIVLLVDDDDNQLFLFKTLFERKQFTVVMAHSAIEAEQFVEQIHVDLIVCDLNMPEVNGRELITRLRRASHLRDLPIVSFTADKGVTSEELIACGANAHCPKSDIASLLRSLEDFSEHEKITKSLLERIQTRFS
jgi:CheY-like chemotaxis protein